MSRKVRDTLRQSGIHNADVVVLGGGPAGTATALALSRRGYSTVVIERSDYRGTRIGETLPSTVQPLLISLGVWDQFLAEKYSPCFGIHSAWGQDHLYHNDFVFSPYGAGWHVDRSRFDQMLAHCAEEAGAGVYRGACLLSFSEDNADSWWIEAGSVGRRHRFRTKFLVDATGRSSCLARRLGMMRITWDRLIGVINFFKPNSPRSACDSFTLIEAVKEGWWYSAVLPDARLVLAYMTDADLYSKAQKQSRNYWSRQLQTTTHTRSRVESYVLTSIPRIVPANSSRLNRVTNGNWLATGDTAMAFDPLSGQGVCKALESALRAAESIQNYWACKDSALRDYALATEQDFDSYLLMRGMFYAREKRWPDSSFWQRRTSTPTRAA